MLCAEARHTRGTTAKEQEQHNPETQLSGVPYLKSQHISKALWNVTSKPCMNTAIVLGNTPVL